MIMRVLVPFTLKAVLLPILLGASPVLGQASGERAPGRPPDEPRVSAFALLELLRLSEPAVCEMAVRALAGGWQEPDGGVELHDRRSGLLGMEELDMPDEASMPELAVVLDDPNACVRRAGVLVLARAGGGGARDALRQGLKSESGRVREAAAVGLGGAGAADEVERLRGALGDPLPHVRRAAAWALGRAATPAAREALRPALRDPDASVREVAARALEPRG